MVSSMFVDMTRIWKPGNVGVPYPVYVLLGISCWSLLIEGTGIVAGMLADNGFHAIVTAVCPYIMGRQKERWIMESGIFPVLTWQDSKDLLQWILN